MEGEFEMRQIKNRQEMSMKMSTNLTLFFSVTKTLRLLFQYRANLILFLWCKKYMSKCYQSKLKSSLIVIHFSGYDWSIQKGLCMMLSEKCLKSLYVYLYLYHFILM